MTAQTYRALLVANSTFPADRYNLPDLEGPRNDPALLRDALCDRDVGLFPPDNVRLVTERTMAEVLGEAEDLLVSATRRDTLLVYYSGHGLLDQSGELFLCTRDTRSDRLRSTAVKASDLSGMMDGSAAGTMVVVLDCCHSGRFKGGDIPATLSGRGRFVVTSSRSGELANDAHVRNHASLFTHHLAEGIVNGAEDHDHDGIVTLSELYDYVRTALAAERRQVPQKRFAGDGDVALARRAVEPTARRLPGLVDPASSAPVLDISEMAIHLGDVSSDEDLPPERIAVINRGGGTLDWVAESSADWVQPVAEGSAVVLHLRPRPGPNRANVYVRDASGALKTVRVSVRVREPIRPAAWEPNSRPSEATDPIEAVRPKSPRAEAPAVQEDEADEEIATTVASRADASPVLEPPSPVTSSPPLLEERLDEAPSRDARVGPRWWCAAAALASLVAGILIAWSSGELVRVIENEVGVYVLLRRQYDGGPLLPEVIAGSALAASGGLSLALLRLRRPSPLAALPSMACCLGFAVPWALFLLGDAAATRHFGGGWLLTKVGSFQVAGWLAAAVAALVGLALFKAGAWHRATWAPKRLVGASVAFATLWALSLGVDFYTRYDESYGSLFLHGGGTATFWFLLAAASVVALIYAGLRHLIAPVGRWLVVAATATPLVVLITELAYVIENEESDDRSAGRLWLMAVPALALVGVGLTAFVLSRREVTEADRLPA
jgi:hypothetical protein